MSGFPEDDELIRLFSSGGKNAEKAFSIIVDKYGKSLYSQIRTIVRNHEDTNDILQDVLVKVYGNLQGFKEDSSLYTWLYRITRNETYTFLTKEKKRLISDLDAPYFEFATGTVRFEQIDSERISELLLEAIRLLPEKQALVFQLKFLEDLQFNEISERTGTSIGALKANYHHARQKIEEILIERLNLL